MITFWGSLVLSYLNHCSKLWSLNNVNLTTGIEVIQRSYAKMVISMHRASYWKKLKKL